MPERYIGRCLGRFRIEALVGSGGFAWVYRGYDPELDIPVAIKVLKPQFAGDETFESRFRREASVAARLRHPNIIRILAVGREADAVYFVMDFLPNSLVERMRTLGPLPEAFTVRMGIEVAQALGFAHREGVIHRDVKADNILFDPHGNAIVADFGIARAVSGYVQETGTNMVVGTPQYFSPEQARGLALDGRADLYSLGVTLFRAATGVLPFEGQDWYEIARQHVEDRPPKPRSINLSISAELERIILRCLAKSPEDRFESGEALAEALAILAPHTSDPGTVRTLQVSRVTPPRAHSGPWAQVAANPWVRRGVLTLGFGAAIVALGFAVANEVTGPPLDAAADTTGTQIAPPTLPPVSAAVPETGSPEPQSSPSLATVRVTAPDSAVITVDGVVRGRGSARLTNVEPGTHVLSATLPAAGECAAASVSRRFIAEAGKTVDLALEPRRCGTLVLHVEPLEATYVLSAPDGMSRSGVVREDSIVLLPAGSYRLLIHAPGCRDYSAEVVIEEGGRVPRFARLLDCAPASPGEQPPA